MRSSLVAIALALSAPAHAQDTPAGDVPAKDAKADAKPDKDVVKASVEEDAQPVRRSIPFRGKVLAYTATPGHLTIRNEKGEPINGVGDTPNRHDMLTGSQLDGTAFTDGQDHTCSNWTSNTAGSGSAQLGHSDRTGGGNMSWNSTHPSRGCSQENLVATGGAGLFYCFAIN